MLKNRFIVYICHCYFRCQTAARGYRIKSTLRGKTIMNALRIHVTYYSLLLFPNTSHSFSFTFHCFVSSVCVFHNCFLSIFSSVDIHFQRIVVGFFLFLFIFFFLGGGGGETLHLGKTLLLTSPIKLIDVGIVYITMICSYKHENNIGKFSLLSLSKPWRLNKIIL